MTQRMDPETRVKIVCVGDPEPMVMTLSDLYASCSWRETGDDLDLEAHLATAGRRVEPGWRTITLAALPAEPASAAATSKTPSNEKR